MRRTWITTLTGAVLFTMTARGGFAPNATGGDNGAELALSTGDTQGKPEIGQSETQRLIQDGAVALVGTYQSAVSMNVAAVADYPA